MQISSRFDFPARSFPFNAKTYIFISTFFFQPSIRATEPTIDITPEDSQNAPSHRNRNSHAVREASRVYWRLFEIPDRSARQRPQKRPLCVPSLQLPRLLRATLRSKPGHVNRKRSITIFRNMHRYGHDLFPVIRAFSDSKNLTIGKFTKTGKFRIHITALPILAEHARYKVWVRDNGVMPFLYGGNVVKAHVARCSDDIPEHQGVVIYDIHDNPLGFGVTARSTVEMRHMEPTAISCFRQADCGEYLRDEDGLFAG